jgi:hypothetical protein
LACPTIASKVVAQVFLAAGRNVADADLAPAEPYLAPVARSEQPERGLEDPLPRRRQIAVKRYPRLEPSTGAIDQSIFTLTM